ncbi:hypothetical protein FKM82_012494 [Ascaphus truei]
MPHPTRIVMLVVSVHHHRTFIFDSIGRDCLFNLSPFIEFIVLYYSMSLLHSKTGFHPPQRFIISIFKHGLELHLQWGIDME